MVKQTKTFKKGNVTKKALSAILAASMVMTSSSFVMAAPVEVEDVAVEADVVDAVAAEEENVGVLVKDATVTVEDATYSGGYVEPKVTVVADGKTLLQGQDFTVKYQNNKNAGYARAVVTFIGEYAGSADVEKEFVIKPMTLTASNTKLDWKVAGYVYTGSKVMPTVEKVTPLGGTHNVITEGEIEIEAYSSDYDLKSVGTQKVKLVSKNSNYVFDDVIGTYTYNIEQAPFALINGEEGSVTVDVVDSFYTGKPVEAEVTVRDRAGRVVDPSTYDILYFDKDGKSSSTAQTDVKNGYKIQIVSNGKGNYQAGGVIEETYNIVPATLEKAAEKATVLGRKVVKDAQGALNCYVTYTGKDQLLSGSDVVITGLTQGSDYEVKVSGAVKNVGDTATITLSGKNNFAGTKNIKVNVVPTVINTKDFTITAKAEKLESDESTPTTEQMNVIIKKGDVTLTEDDFKLGTIDASRRIVQIIGSGNYTTIDPSRDDKDYIEVAYTQAYKNLIEKATVTVNGGKAMTWTGKQITPAVVVTYEGQTLKKDVDYTVAYGTNIDCGKEAGVVTVTGKGDYEGTQEVKFDINGTDISSLFSATASNVTTDAIKAGKGKSTPVVKFTNGASVPNDFTYTVKYYKYLEGAENHKGIELTDTTFKTLVENDKVVAQVTGTGKYSGSVYAKYTVVKAKDIAETAKIGDIADQAYTGKAIEPNVVVTPTTLKKGKDYTISYMANTEVGTAYVVVSGIGEYAGELVKAFKIVGEMPQTIDVLAAQERDLGNGSRTLNSKATKVKYTAKTAVTFKSSDESVVTVDAEGNIKYTGFGEATITITAAAENGYKAATKELKVVVKLAKPSFTPFSKNDAFTLTSSTVKGAEKFEVEYATKKDFSNSKTKTFATTSAGKIRQVKVSASDKKTYYVRVRAISGTTQSAWSGVKTVATK